MNKYKINYIFSEEDINEIFIRVLNAELKRYIGMICKNKKYLVQPCTQFFQKGGGNC